MVIHRVCAPPVALVGACVAVFALVVTGLVVQPAFAQSATNNVTGASEQPDQAGQAGQSGDGSMTSAEILALFQREARAAYQMNKEACEPLPAEEKKICLAKARLQFDADMRYAQKRADQGY